MSRYIDADALKENFTCAGEEWINNIIDDAPSIDIVRCKECKYWDTEWIPASEDADVHWCSYKDLVEYGDWFCADGERRE